MINSNAYPDQFEMVDLTRHRASSSSSNLSSTAKQVSDEKYMLRVMPKLIRWRLLLFYAPYFRGTGFEHSLLNPNPNLNLNSTLANTTRNIGTLFYPANTLPRLSHRSLNTLNPIISANATHKARVLATSTLASLEEDLHKLNLPLLATSYSHERELQRRRTTLLGPLFAALCPRPTIALFESVAEKLAIPLRQIEAAVSTYALYTQILLHPGVYMEARRPAFAAEKLCAEALAGEKRWCDLADVVADDLEDVCGGAGVAFSKFERGLEGLRSEMAVFRAAVDACAATYQREMDGAVALECGHRGCGSGRDRGSRGRVLGGRLGLALGVRLGVRMPEKGMGMKLKNGGNGDGTGRVAARWSRCLKPLRLRRFSGSGTSLSSIPEE